MDFMAFPAVWGMIGSGMYALPKILICARDHPGGWRACLAELVVSVLIGTGAAAAFAPSAAAYLQRAGPDDARAIATLIGLMANPLSPRVVSILGGIAERWGRDKAP